jgi:cytochrome P450
MQSYTTQRDPTYFPNPDQYDPGRWITKDGGSINPGTPEARDMLLVWGKGSRACLGQHLATMQVKILLARVIGRFQVRLASEATHAEMEMTDHFTLIPKGRRCGLIFSEL